MKPDLDTRRACALWTAREMIQEAYAPLAPSGSGPESADFFKLQAAALAAVEAYAHALWSADLIPWADPTSMSAAHACRAVVRAIADESYPKAAENRESHTHIAHVARLAAKSPTAQKE